MEIMLLAITVVSLILAFIMSAAAWRLTRAERERAAARTAMLSAAASEPEVPRAPARPMPAAPAATEPLMVGELRAAPWTPARVSSFASPRSGMAAAAHLPAIDELPLSPSTSPSTAVGHSFLGGTPATTTGGGQRGLAIAAVILFAVIAGGGYWTVFGDRSSGAAAAAATTIERSPLELVSLRHERRGSRLAVTGLVRNPVAGSPVNTLTAVVFLFDQQGGFLTSARTNVEFAALAPGDETPFVVDVDAPASVARYRVSFRTDAGVVPHIDRRGQEPIATTAVTVSGQR